MPAFTRAGIEKALAWQGWRGRRGTKPETAGLSMRCGAKAGSRYALCLAREANLVNSSHTLQVVLERACGPRYSAQHAILQA